MKNTNFSKLFQLVILPRGDINKPTGMIICCPFTKVIVEGKTFDVALQRWKAEASRQYVNCSFSVPSPNKFCSRKVWYTTTTTKESEESVFLIDFSSDIPLESLVINPETRSVKKQTEYDSLGAMFDWKVCCSPIIEMQEIMASHSTLQLPQQIA
eukprot:CAMPEP_0117041500 /NCGR_PEP_ID=MMETSP0472-20121206/28975_1 /TAXON_ID=693140 ORGANISM="Tiarina fusus, Strain LIS" /NCGR_SAMPLE_ID=MMETSP0472 /ASSEMBLY_ACC=CAM_ASM_000603 /LENGTH=154 /DNA_ID=CAMNT_0004752521 /DNA_START=20 /DNA_END=484 /DNA_ORIENTATION=+